MTKPALSADRQSQRCLLHNSGIEIASLEDSFAMTLVNFLRRFKDKIMNTNNFTALIIFHADAVHLPNNQRAN